MCIRDRCNTDPVDVTFRSFALFDLVDARRLEVVGAESEKILEEMKGWLSVAGMASENFTWLAQSNNFEISVSESHPGFNH